MVKYDADGDGELTEKESKLMCEEISDSLVDLTIAMCDPKVLDKMGGRGSYREKLQSEVGNANHIFRKIDSDGDKVLTTTEM